MGLEIKAAKRAEDNVVVCSLKGSLNTETYMNFTEQMMKYLVDPLKGVVLDLQFLDYVSSMGVGAILDARRMTENLKASFVMVNIPPKIEEVFKVVQVMPLVKVFGSLREADKFLMNLQMRSDK